MLDVCYHLVPAKAFWTIYERSGHKCDPICGQRIFLLGGEEHTVHISSPCHQLNLWIYARKSLGTIHWLDRDIRHLHHRIRKLEQDLDFQTILKVMSDELSQTVVDWAVKIGNSQILDCLAEVAYNTKRCGMNILQPVSMDTCLSTVFLIVGFAIGIDVAYILLECLAYM